MDEGAVGEHHRVVEQYRAVAVPVDKLDEKVGEDIGPELAFVGAAGRLVGVHIRVPVTGVAVRIAPFAARPDGPLVKSVSGKDVRLDTEVVDLPLAGDGGRVPGIPQQSGERHVVFRVEVAPRSPARHIPVVCPAVSKRVLSRQQRHARWRALRHGVGVPENHSTRCQVVDVGCLDSLAAVAGDPFRTQVVCHDQDDVRWSGPGRRSQQKNAEPLEQPHRTHRVVRALVKECRNWSSRFRVFVHRTRRRGAGAPVREPSREGLEPTDRLVLSALARDRQRRARPESPNCAVLRPDPLATGRRWSALWRPQATLECHPARRRNGTH